jgi:hypothetical protein
MPAKSKAQQKLFGLALAYKRGEITDVSDEVKELSKLPEKDLEDYASTSHKGLPDKVEESTTMQEIEKLLSKTFKKNKYDFAKDLLTKILDKKYKENGGKWRHSLVWYAGVVANQINGVDARTLASKIDGKKYKLVN